jgi:hypothetical protein
MNGGQIEPTRNRARHVRKPTLINNLDACREHGNLDRIEAWNCQMYG